MNTDMKKVFLALMMGMIMLGAMAQDGKFTVRGTFKHVGDSVHFLLRDLGVGESRAVTGEMLEVSFDLKDATEITIGRWFKGRGNEEKGDVTETTSVADGQVRPFTFNFMGMVGFRDTALFFKYYPKTSRIVPDGGVEFDYCAVGVTLFL